MLERVIALPYQLKDDRLLVAIADPANISGIDELRLATRHQIELGVAVERRDPRRDPPPHARDEQMTHVRRPRRHPSSSRTTTQTELEADDGVSDAPLVRLVNSILFQAAEDGASDVHFMPEEDALVVRYRIDGVLQEMQRIPKRMAQGVTTRLKVLAKLDIAERRKPQDGRISLNAASAGRMLDIRVAVLPTVEGECCVMRLIDKSKKPPTLESIGLNDEMRVDLEEIINKPYGALLVTGPTGSGKSTTLYAGIGLIASPDINVITVEDPVEYRLSGINQVQINVKAGLTFAAALRSILRSDPDVVMVGEIRDAETAKISIEAALTGHMVLSTLHTNDAPGALTRLNEMGVEPFLVGAAVSGVLAQRLARKLCSNCGEMYTPTAEDLIEAKLSPDVAAQMDGMAFYRKVGCPRCNQTGYKGRVGIFQLLQMTEELASHGRVEGDARGHRARRHGAPACARSGTTAWPRWPRVSRPWRSSPVSSFSSPPCDEASRYSVEVGICPARNRVFLAGNGELGWPFCGAGRSRSTRRPRPRRRLPPRPPPAAPFVEQPAAAEYAPPVEDAPPAAERSRSSSPSRATRTCSTCPSAR